MPTDLGVDCRSPLGVFHRSALGVRACPGGMSFLAAVGGTAYLYRRGTLTRTQTTGITFISGAEIDPEGYIWVHSGSFGGAFQVFNPDGSLRFDQSDVAGYATNFLVDIAVDEDGNAYMSMLVSDDEPNHHSVWSLDRNGNVRWTHDEFNGFDQLVDARELFYRDGNLFVELDGSSGAAYDIIKLGAAGGAFDWGTSNASAASGNPTASTSGNMIAASPRVAKYASDGNEEWVWPSGFDPPVGIRAVQAAELSDGRVIAGSEVHSSGDNIWLLSASGTLLDSDDMAAPGDMVRNILHVYAGGNTAYATSGNYVLEIGATSSDQLTLIDSINPSGVNAVVRSIGKRVGAELESWLEV